jgi:hypothetical protein
VERYSRVLRDQEGLAVRSVGEELPSILELLRSSKSSALSGTLSPGHCLLTITDSLELYLPMHA